MKRYYLILLTVLAAACNNNPQQADSATTNTDSAAADKTTVETYCYLRTAGNEQQDTAAIKLTINGDSVTGAMNYFPYEKDSRTGTLQGLKNGNKITMEYTCMQEGMEFTIPVVLLIESNRVLQQTTSFNENGEEYIPEGAPFEAEYQLIDCKLFPERNF